MIEPRVPKEEYADRVKRLQAKMAEQDLDAVLCYAHTGTYDNVFYLTQYWPLFEVGGALIGRSGDPLVLMGGEAPEFAGAGPFGIEAVRGCTNFGHTSGSVRGWVGVKYYSLAELIEEITGGKAIKRIGLADWAITPINLYNDIKNSVPADVEIVDATQILVDLRMNKSKLEIELVRHSCLLAEKAFDEMLGRVTPEMTEYELEGLLCENLYKWGGEGPSFPILCYSGYRSRMGIGRSTHNKLGRDTMINIDIGPHFGGYASAYGRPIYFGKMPDSMKKEIDFMIGLHEKLICEWVKPGMTSGEVYAKYYDAFVEGGWGPPPASASHGIGVFEGEPPTFRRDVPTVLNAGMTIAGDHFFRSQDYGFRFEDCYVITETGTELFTKSHWECIEL